MKKDWKHKDLISCSVQFGYWGELGTERLLELLAASFDWDASLRDPAAALAYLGRRPEEKLNYEAGDGAGCINMLHEFQDG